MGLDNRSRTQWRECYERAMDDLRHAKKRARLAEERLAAVRDFVDDPGNWSVLDGRRELLLILIDGLPYADPTNITTPPGDDAPDQTGT